MFRAEKDKQFCLFETKKEKETVVEQTHVVCSRVRFSCCNNISYFYLESSSIYWYIMHTYQSKVVCHGHHIVHISQSLRSMISSVCPKWIEGFVRLFLHSKQNLEISVRCRRNDFVVPSEEFVGPSETNWRFRSLISSLQIEYWNFRLMASSFVSSFRNELFVRSLCSK